MAVVISRLRTTTGPNRLGRSVPKPSRESPAIKGNIKAARLRWNCHSPIVSASRITTLSTTPMMAMELTIRAAAKIGEVGLAACICHMFLFCVPPSSTIANPDATSLRRANWAC